MNQMTMTSEAKLILRCAIDHGNGRYEFPSVVFVIATQMTRRRLPKETLPPN